MSMELVINDDIVSVAFDGLMSLNNVTTLVSDDLDIAPSEIVAEYLISSLGLFYDPEDINESGNTAQWPLFVGYMPDDVTLNKCAAVYDLMGIEQGRLMAGQVLEMPCCQIKIRATTITLGRDKIEEAIRALEACLNTEIVIGEITYRIQNITRTSSVLPLGMERGTKRRYLFTINFKMVLDIVS